MDDSEKKRLRNIVFSYLAQHPLHLPTRGKISSFNFSSFFASRISIGIYSLVALVLCVGISQAAEQSIPGDKLYAVKVNINEPLLKTISVSQVAKAKTYATIAERRLIEIEKVTLKSQQSDEVLTTLNQDFKENADKVHTFVSQMQSKGELTSADEINSDFKTTLETHSEIINEVEDTQVATSVATSSIMIANTMTMRAVIASTTPLSPIKSELQNQNERSETSEKNIVGALASSTDKNHLRVSAEKRIQRSQEKIEELRNLIEDVQNDNADTVEDTTEEEARLKEAEQTQAQAEEQLKENNIAEAIELSSQAREMAQEATIRAKVETELKTVDNVDISINE